MSGVHPYISKHNICVIRYACVTRSIASGNGVSKFGREDGIELGEFVLDAKSLISVKG